MKKSTKTFISSMLAVGTVFGIGASVETPQVKEAHAATTPYYSYQGYAGNDPSFVLNQQFITSLQYDNFKINGYKISSTTGKNLAGLVPGSKTVTKYDQEFNMVNKEGTQADIVSFKVRGNLTVKQLKNAYGKKLRKLPGGSQTNSNSGYAYSPNDKHYGIYFDVKNDKVTQITIGVFGVTGE
ncbi:hypothetical protein HU002_02885 [Staphylococcus sp. SS251]|nr:hypothetical protein [Staphylococcus singaporensis]MBE5677830.1 hypothetical protein [Staphylococcus singaporensis]MCS5348690.1 hypothetical protein [Staphylococcus aureus]